jgi:hypothetical protein
LPKRTLAFQTKGGALRCWRSQTMKANRGQNGSKKQRVHGRKRRTGAAWSSHSSSSSIYIHKFASVVRGSSRKALTCSIQIVGQIEMHVDPVRIEIGTLDKHSNNHQGNATFLLCSTPLFMAAVRYT